MLSLHDAVAQEALRIVACSGNEFGAGAATLKLQNLRDEELEIFVPAGSILQHANWVHLQNLLIGLSRAPVFMRVVQFIVAVWLPGEFMRLLVMWVFFRIGVNACAHAFVIAHLRASCSSAGVRHPLPPRGASQHCIVVWVKFCAL